VLDALRAAQRTRKGAGVSFDVVARELFYRKIQLASGVLSAELSTLVADGAVAVSSRLFKPLIGVAAELFSSLVADWAMKRQQAEAKAKAKSDSPPIPEPTQAPPQVAPAEPVGVLPDAPTSVEPAQSHLAKKRRK